MAAGSAIRAGPAYVELFTRDSKLIAGLNRAAARVRAFGASITALGAHIAGLGLIMALPLLGAAKAYADMGADLLEMSQRTGLSVEALSELRFAAEQSGTSLEDLETGIKKMSRLLVAAEGGSKEAQDALAKLGLTIQ